MSSSLEILTISAYSAVIDEIVDLADVRTSIVFKGSIIAYECVKINSSATM